MRFLSICAVASLALQATAVAIDRSLQGFKILEHPDPAKRDVLQDIVTWDASSLFIRGERIMVFSGEFHPYRLPVPTLWLDVFQKIKALGFNTVSFYVHWALLEGKAGDYSAEGVFAWEPFFDAATEAGIYLIARPGPYINAEASGGGFPGWLQRVKGKLRTAAPDYLKSTDNYVANIGKVIAKAQITNGGPVILYQPENEYSGSCCGVEFPDGDYMQYVIDQARDAGIVVPMISNDAYAGGHNAPGTGVGEVDIYGHDSYPLGFDCANPTVWPTNSLPTTFRTSHLQQSPSTPYSLNEFQAGSFDPWGGLGFDQCAALVNHEFERVFYKNDFSFGAAILNLYMIFGGTNWGNLGHPGGYTSYDYGSPIAEDRTVTREKYSELKLIGNFMKASPLYLDAIPGNLTTGVYTDTSDLSVTPLLGKNSSSSFFVLRHADATTQTSTSYKLKLPTSAGSVTIPQLGGSLTLSGRDSKIHVTDYDVSGTKILYSSAEVFTWKVFQGKKILIVYGGPGELHELAINAKGEASVIEGSASDVKTKQTGGSLVINWKTSSERRIVSIGNVQILLLDRNSAYNYWVPELAPSGQNPGFTTHAHTASSIIVRAGYLVRTAYTQGDQLHLTADFNATAPIEVFGAPTGAKSLYINGDNVPYKVSRNGYWTASIDYQKPAINLPKLTALEWKYFDTLPELQPSYDDSAWTSADHKTTDNPTRNLTTPTSLYSSDYGYHTGYLLYRGHFIAQGNETSLFLHTQGGSAFGSSVWLNSTYVGSWTGIDKDEDYNSTYTLPNLKAGKPYVLTVLIDNNGLDENWIVGQELMKTPRGILDYRLSGRDATAISWKLTGNLGGEDYVDRTRGPLNEGGLYAERQGWHQPEPPSNGWKTAGIADGVSKAGVGWFTTSFDLDLPQGWDVPLYFTFGNSTSPPPAYRAQLYVNGWQFGKYVNNVGPQTSFPVPEGILDHHGKNWLAVSLWALEAEGAKLDSFVLEYRQAVKSALKDIEVVDSPAYEKRKGAY